MKKISTMIMVTLIVLSTLSILTPHAKVEDCCEVSPLPAGAWYPHGKHPDHLDSARLDRIDLDPTTLGNQQCVIVGPSEEVTIEYSAWLMGNPGEIRQFWFVYSWASSWPPWDAYTPIFNGHPAESGTVVSDTFMITAPSTPGAYKVWLCVESKYSMGDAVAECTEEPTMLPHACIVVGTEGEITWASTSSLPAVRAQHASVAYNGRIYVLGGWEHAGSNTVYYGDVNPDGTIDSWLPTMSLPERRSETAAVAYNDYIYLLGGQGPQPPYRIERDTVYYAPINPDGTLGSWNTTTPLPEKQSGHGAFVWNGRIYVLGGWSGYSFQSHVYFAEPNPDGTLGSWISTSSLPSGRGHGIAAVAHNGYAYALGGQGPDLADKADVWKAEIYPNGSLGPWETQPSMPLGLETHGVAVVNDEIYVIGGVSQGMSPSQRAEVFRATINPDGALGAWTSDTELALPIGIEPRGHLLQTPVWNDRIYVIGGTDETGAATETVYYTRAHVSAIVDIDPDTLNLKSNGQWITAYVELPETYDVNDIDVSSILVNDTIPVDIEAPATVGDYDLDGVPDLMVKFDRASIIELVGTIDYPEDTGKSYLVTLTVTGKILDVTFEGSDTVKAIH